jgi:hypothetical protein
LKLLLLCIQCRWCGLTFCLCRRCWRGHAYCCDACRREGKRKNHRKAQRKYRRTKKGKKNHCEAENRRRHGNTQRKPKNMDDATSTPRHPWAMKIVKRITNLFLCFDIEPICHFCGAHGWIVATFPRRGYG